MKTKTQSKQTARHPLTIGELMTAAPNTIGSEQTLSKAHAIMREHDVRHLPVLDAGKVVGILSQRDLYFLEAIAGVDIQIDQVADAMTPDVYTTDPKACVRDVARVMAEHKYGCAVVLEGRHVVGIFTATDALRHLADALHG